jgi:cellulose biosynthesis protein BcsQ
VELVKQLRQLIEAGLNKLGKKLVLLIDLDPQAN